MNPAMISDLLRRLGQLETRSTQHRTGVVTAVDPLAVALGGSTDSYTNVQAIGGASFAVGDTVSVLRWDGDMIVLGASSSSGDASLAAKVQIIREARPNLDQLGASGNGVSNDTAYLAQAAATGIVYELLPGRRYITTAPVQLANGGGFVGHNKFGMEDLTNTAAVRSEIMQTTPGAAAVVMPRGHAPYEFAAVKIDGVGLFTATNGTCLAVPNGALGVEIGDLVLHPGAGGKGVHHKGFIQDWRAKHIRSYGGKYGWFCDAEHAEDMSPGDDSYACRMDDCDLRLFLSGASKYSGHMRVPLSDSCTLRLRIVSAQEHGFVLSGGFAGLVIDNANFEANGFGQYSATSLSTTGSITAGSNLLTVASPTGFATGQTVCVQGAGLTPYAEALEGPRDLVTTISSIAGSVLTLAATASVTVANADVTRALYSDFYCGADLGSPEGSGTTLSGGPGNVTFISPSWGLSNYLRYGADLSGIAYGLKVINPKAGVRPGYDPFYRIIPDEDPLGYAQYRPTRKWQLINDTAAGGLNRFATGWSSTTGQNVAVRRVGRTVYLRGYATADATGTGTVCTLPWGCRPSRPVVFHQVWDASNAVTGVGIIGTDGVVSVYISPITGATCFADGFSFTID